MEHNVGASQEQRRSRDNGAIQASDERGAECGEKTRSAAVPPPILILIPVNIFQPHPPIAEKPIARDDKTRQDKTDERREDKTRQDKTRKMGP
jgi:hypothetical protein